MATKVEVQLLTDIKDSLKAIETFNKSFSSSFDQVAKSAAVAEKSVTSFSGSLQRIGEFFTAELAASVVEEAFRGIVDLFKEGIGEAAKYETALNELNTALALSGNFSTEASKGFEEFASQIQQTTRFSDDAVLSAGALIEQITHLDEESLKQATQGAIDLASALRIDLDSAARLVAKSAEGNVEAFKRYGIEIKKGVTDTETFANTLQAISRFSGTANASINTFDGSLARLSNNFGDFIKNLGNIIIKNPAVIAGINELNNLFISLTEEIQKNTGVAILAFGQSLSTAGSVILGIVAVFSVLERGIGGLIEIFIEFGRVIGATAFAITQIIGGDFAGAFETLKTAASDAAKNVLEAFGSDKFSVLIGNNVASIKGAIDQGLSSGTKSVDKFFKDLQTKAGSGAAGTVAEISKEFKKLKEELDSSLGGSTVKAKIERDKRLEIVADELKRRTISEKEASLVRDKIEEDFTKKVREENRKRVEEAQAAVQKAFVEPFKALTIGGISGTEKIGAGLGIFSQSLKGFEGAVKAVSGVLQAIVSIIPGFQALAPVIGTIFEQLAQGPEKVGKGFKEFLDAAPQILKNIIGSIFEVILIAIRQGAEDFTNIADVIQNILGQVVEKIPQIITTIITQIPNVIAKFIDAFGVIVRAIGPLVPNLINGIIAAIPDIIQGFIANLPTLFRALVAGFTDSLRFLPQLLVQAIPSFITAFAQQAPRIAFEIIRAFGSIAPQAALQAAIAFGSAMVQQAPRIAAAIVTSLGQFLGSLFDSIIKKVEDAFNNITGGGGLLGNSPLGQNGGGGGGGFLGDIGNFLGFADGGRVPDIAAFNNDGGIARVSSGEQILSKDLSSKLEDFLGSNGQPQMLTINLKVGEQDLAKAIFNLNRQGFRTA